MPLPEIDFNVDQLKKEFNKFKKSVTKIDDFNNVINKVIKNVSKDSNVKYVIKNFDTAKELCYGDVFGGYDSPKIFFTNASGKLKSDQFIQNIKEHEIIILNKYINTEYYYITKDKKLEVKTENTTNEKSNEILRNFFIWLMGIEICERAKMAKKDISKYIKTKDKNAYTTKFVFLPKWDFLKKDNKSQDLSEKNEKMESDNPSKSKSGKKVSKFLKKLFKLKEPLNIKINNSKYTFKSFKELKDEVKTILKNCSELYSDKCGTAYKKYNNLIDELLKYSWLKRGEKPNDTNKCELQKNYQTLVEDGAKIVAEIGGYVTKTKSNKKSKGNGTTFEFMINNMKDMKLKDHKLESLVWNILQNETLNYKLKINENENEKNKESEVYNLVRNKNKEINPHKSDVVQMISYILQFNKYQENIDKKTSENIKKLELITEKLSKLKERIESTEKNKNSEDDKNNVKEQESTQETNKGKSKSNTKYSKSTTKVDPKAFQEELKEAINERRKKMKKV